MEKCPVCNRDGSQYCLIDMVQDQSKTGGYMNISLNYKDGAAGPFWRSTTWEKFIQNTQKAANNGCLHASEVIDRVNEITKEKMKAGELV